MSESGNVETLYRKFLTIPYATSALKRGGKKRKRVRGGKVNRFGAPLSGNANIEYLFGAPTGGADGIETPMVRGAEYLGGRRKRVKRGRGMRRDLTEEFINPALAYRHTYPPIGTNIY